MSDKSEQHQERRISYIWGLILTALILLTGVYVYALMEQQAKSFLGKSLEALLQNKVHLFDHYINQGQGMYSKEGILLQHPLITALENEQGILHSKPHQTLQLIAESFIEKKFFAVSIYNAQGKELAKAGKFSTNFELRVPLNSTNSYFLLWDGQFILNATNDVHSNGKYIGKIVTEKVVPQLTLAFSDVASIGETGEFAICKLLAKDLNNMQCFLNGFAGKKFFQRQPRIIKGKPLPMSYALDGETGLIFAKDYRKQDVVAAYSAVDTLGLGIVIKIDQNELYSPITNKLKFIIPALMVLVFLGMLLLRWLVTPLVRKLIKSEHETKNTNVELSKSKMSYRLVLDNSPYCIHEIDREGRLTSMNPTGLKMLDVQSESEIKNSPYIKDVSDEDKTRVARLMEAGLQGKQSDFEFKGSNGKIYQSSFVPIQDDEGGALRLMGWSQDITERKKMEMALIKSKNKAEEANRAKSVFLSSMSHEIRTPLNAILGFSQLIEMNTEDELTKGNVREIIDAGKHLLELIDELLELSQIESGKVNLYFDSYSLKNILEFCLSMVKTSADKISIQIDNKVDSLPDIKINVDEKRFKQVVLNLLSNAIKYNKENGSVIIDYSLEDEKILCLSVTDTGKGIAPNHQDNVFDYFDRAGQEGSNITGSGLGLAISKKLIEKMNGSIGFESITTEGSRFWVKVPLS